ncbi:adenosylcobinamide amidohydrolase [Methanobrevibacter sp. AbM4]|uniref:adenosylcobinamide amidohydrolase n=1 Tax=Methanobrevibacter sp. AbM4 TaxID=224719 RepID=UPI0003348531|nr:adenosylcobinamide amidohydrolase [Methanobrevibacter sp. AbM4]AGN16645.1 adenosylcobinamide amidohydrolase CbiZ [Methanobrevibacter sp. AbM4]
MLNEDFKLIYETDSHDKIYTSKDFLVVKFPYGKNGISISYLNGGYRENLESVFNQHLSDEEINKINMDRIVEYLKSKARSLDLNVDKTSSLLTHADIKNTSIIKKSFKKLSVTAITTAGTKINAVRAGDPASYYEENHRYYDLKDNKLKEDMDVGTINIILIFNCHLNENSLLDALMTATEAKSAILQQLQIPSQYSSGIATGTGTDGIILISDKKSNNVIENTGKHSKLGELIGSAVEESIAEANLKQTWISPSSQSNVLTLLYRYKLDINDFYKDFTSQEKETFIKNLKSANHNPKMVAITLTVTHIIDDVNYNLMASETGYSLAISIINDIFTSNDSIEVKRLLLYWIDYYLK